MCTFSGTLTKDFFVPFTSDFEAWCLGIECRATASERHKENRVKRELDCFVDAIIYFVGYDSCAGNWFHKSPPKYFHKAVRHNTDPVLRGHHYWACLRSWRFLGVFCLLWFKKLELQPHESWTVVEQGSIELFLKATSEMPRASVSRRG